MTYENYTLDCYTPQKILKCILWTKKSPKVKGVITQSDQNKVLCNLQFCYPLALRKFNELGPLIKKTTNNYYSVFIQKRSRNQA